MALQPDSTFAHYRIGDSIGAGGMGEVFRALDTKLDREVAIKVLPESFAQDADRTARFEREAHTLASLNHSNIGMIFGLEKEGGVTGLVMELIEGPTLEDRIKQGPLPPDEALGIARQIIDGLEAAHDRGIVHRDLKPANIKVKADGLVKILDFGIAKSVEHQSSSNQRHSPTMVTPAVTESGVIMGTAAYMSPEQARGKFVDQRTDIWAFGCLLYEMLTGQPAFGGTDVAETMARIITLDADTGSLTGVINPAVNKTIKLCLQKDPRKRIADIRDVKLALNGEFETVAAQPVSTLALPMVTAVVVTAIVIGLGAWYLQPEASRGIVAAQRLSIVLPANLPIESISSPALPLALSPDGTQLVYLATAVDMPDESMRNRLVLRSLDTLAVRELQGTAGARQPFFSPDGQWLAFFTNGGELKKISLAGGNPITLLDGISGSPWSFGVWSEDGTIIFGTLTTGLRRISAEGGVATDLTTLNPAVDEQSHNFPSLVPAKRAVLFNIVNDKDLSMRIEAVMLDSGERQVVVENGRRPLVLDSGHLLFQRDNATLIAPFDLGQLRVTGPAQPLVDAVQRDHLEFYTGPRLAVSRNGTLAYQPAVDRSQSLMLVGLDGQVEPLRSPSGYGWPRVSPDGRTIGYIESSGQVRLYDLQRGTSTRLGQDNSAPLFSGVAWRPDSRALAVASQNGISLWNLDGTQRLLLATPPGVTRLSSMSWSPDGAHLAYTVQTGAQHDIWVLTLGETPTTAPLLDSAASEYSPGFSPDGRWLAYQSDESGRFEIYLQQYPQGLRIPVSTDGGEGAVWSPDGRELYFEGSDGGEPKLMAVSVTAAGEGLQLGQPLAQFDLRIAGSTGVLERYAGSGNAGVSYDILPDGKRFVMFKVADAAGAREVIIVQNWFEELKRLVPNE